MTAPKRRPLGELLSALPATVLQGSLAVEVDAATYDSRTVSSGTLFVALPGATFDGHDFAEQACAQGASALLVERAVEAPADVAVVQVPDTRAALPALARALYDDPSSELRVAGITGTNGKTTVSFLLHEALMKAGRRAGLIGTLGVKAPGLELPTRNTTPESLDLQRLLRQMRDGAVTDVALEVSSHALAGHRVDGLTFGVRIFHNLGRDHLDLHGDLKHYFAAKARLLREFAGAAWCNLDDAHGRHLAAEIEGCLGYSARGAQDAALRVLRAEWTRAGLRAQVESPRGPFELRSPLVGGFNLDNLLAACAAALSLGLSAEELAQGLQDAVGAPGRLQRVTDPAGEIEVFVDYAHTPDALAGVLSTLRDYGTGRLVVVFGCGGDRDRGKRPEMGAAAAAGADLLVITDDNPRSEPSQAILEDILGGVPAAAERLVEPDRARAIRLAIEAAAPGDVVLIAGKGHEAYQERGGRRSPFSDVDEAGAALAGPEAR